MTPRNEGPTRTPRGLWQPLWRDRLLIRLFLLTAALVGYQLMVTLVQPGWAALATQWLRVGAAWLAFATLVLVGWHFARTDRPQARAWWMLGLAMLAYALGQTLAAASQLVLFPARVPFPWWTDILFLLEYVFFFLTLALWPGRSQPGGPGALHWKVLFDSLLLMAAATALSWYFVLAPLYLDSQEPVLGRAINIAYASGDLALLFGLALLLVPRRAHPDQAERVALGILAAATVFLIVGDTWYAWLNLSHRYTPAAPPALFWLIATVLAALAAVAQLRLVQSQPSPAQAQPRVSLDALPGQSRVLQEVARVLLPFLAGLLASGAIALRAIVAPVRPMAPLIPVLVIFGLLLLVVMRQGVTLLETSRLQHRWALALAREQALLETNRRMETFLGIAGHELKTPLTSVILSLQRLERRARHQVSRPTGEGLEEQRVEISRQDLELPLEQSKRLNRLVGELLDTSRIQAGRLELQLALTDLVDLVRAAVEEECQAFAGRTVALSLPPAPVLVLADADRLGQVVANYLSNALKYSPEECPVAVGVQVEGRRGRVWVRDLGPGVLPDAQERIWERFYRVPGIESQSGSGIGLGLGLYISRTIIEHHGGEAGVQSSPGQGATFWFTLPLTAPEAGT
jgi:signal transduction histidine kinase